jgi:hypothetical protein
MRERAGGSAATWPFFEKWGMLMRSLRCAVALAVLALLLALTPASAQDKVLAAGDPPLTQGVVNSYRAFFSYLLAVKFDADDNKKFHDLVVADWKEWDKTTRAAFVKQMAEWKTVSKKGDKFSYRAKLLPKYLDRQGDPKKTSATERWMLESYQSAYKKLADKRPSALMDKQPAASAPLVAEGGFPADPKHPNIFPRAVVFTSSQLFARRWGLTSYKDRRTGQTHSNVTYWWFFPSGRFYTRNIRCLGSTKVKGMEKEILAPTYYLEGRTIDESWGRYTIDDRDRLQMETDKGEKITMHLTYGRQQVNWAGTVYDAPPMKKK